MKQLKIATAVTTLIVGCCLIFYSCKKSDVSKEGIRENLSEIYRQKLENKPIVTTEILNIPGKAYYGDINGNPLTMAQMRLEQSTCPDPADTEAEQSFVSMEREYTCGVGYRFVVTYKVISEFYIVPGSSPNISGGRVRLRNGTTTIHTTAFAALASITNNGVVGTNSNGDDLNEFIVTFRTDIVLESTYNSATSIQPNALLYTDCPDIPSVGILYSTQQSTNGAQHTTLPCLRVDKVYANPSSGLGTSVAGCYATPTCFPSGYVFPDQQDIEIYANGMWQDIGLWRNAVGGGFQYQRGYIDIIDYWYVDMTGYAGSPSTISAGWYQVRYRNRMTTGTPCTTLPSGLWVEESWYISI